MDELGLVVWNGELPEDLATIFNLLDPVHCAYCGEKLSRKNIGAVMPHGDAHVTICDNLCIVDYVTETLNT